MEFICFTSYTHPGMGSGRNQARGAFLKNHVIDSGQWQMREAVDTEEPASRKTMSRTTDFIVRIN